MKQIIISAFVVLYSLNAFCQSDELLKLIAQGVELHDQGRYHEAIAKYMAALDIDKKSALANYEIAYSYFAVKQYNKAIKHSTIAIKQNEEHQHESYVILGNCLDLSGKPAKAIKTYEEALQKFPDSYMLYYNLGLTCLNNGKIDKAEEAAINAIEAKPTHSSSHILLSGVMLKKGERIKSLLPLYYHLMIEPNSARSIPNYKALQSELNKGIEKKDDHNINVNISLAPISSSDFGAAEMMVSLMASSRFMDKNKNKNEMELFVEANKSIFGILGELKKDNKGFWWDFYVTKFYDLIQTDNLEAFSYHISQSTKSEAVTTWINDNPDKMQKFSDWLKKK